MNDGLRAAFEAQYHKNQQAMHKWFDEYVGAFLDPWKPTINQNLGLTCELAHEAECNEQ